jgi:hypothetical protein
MKKRKSQKPSWQYLFYARRIQTGPRHVAAKLLLLHLADAADDNGRSWHGYKSISAFCNGLSKSSIYCALVYLRDELKILTWKTGSGGFNKKDTNTYTLDMEAMKALVCAQGVFDSETGKLIRSEDDSQVLSPNSTEPKSVSVSEPSVGIGEAPVGIGEASVGIGEHVSRYLSPIPNPHGTPTYKPPERNPGPAVPFSADGSISPNPQTRTAVRNAPPLAGTPHEHVFDTPFRYGDPIPGLKWSEHRGAYIDAAGREVSTKEVDTRIAVYETARKETSNAGVWV